MESNVTPTKQQGVLFFIEYGLKKKKPKRSLICTVLIQEEVFDMLKMIKSFKILYGSRRSARPLHFKAMQFIKQLHGSIN